MNDCHGRDRLRYSSYSSYSQPFYVHPSAALNNAKFILSRLDPSLLVLLLMYSVWLALLFLFALPFMVPFSLPLLFVRSVIVSFLIPISLSLPFACSVIVLFSIPVPVSLPL